MSIKQSVSRLGLCSKPRPAPLVDYKALTIPYGDRIVLLPTNYEALRYHRDTCRRSLQDTHMDNLCCS